MPYKGKMSGNKVCISQLVKAFKNNKSGVPISPRAFHMLFDKYGFGKILNYYVDWYDKSAAYDLIYRKWQELVEFQKDINLSKKKVDMMKVMGDYDKQENAYYSPKDMSKASLELLKNDDVWYGDDVRECAKKTKTVIINENQLMALWNE